MQDPSAQSTPFQVASPAHPNLSAPMLQLPVARHVHSGFSQHSAENFFQGLVPPGFVPPGFVPPGFVPPGSGPHAQFPLGAVPPGFVSAVAAWMRFVEVASLDGWGDSAMDSTSSSMVVRGKCGKCLKRCGNVWKPSD